MQVVVSCIKHMFENGVGQGEVWVYEAYEVK